MRPPIDTLGFDLLIPTGRQVLTLEGKTQILVESRNPTPAYCCDSPNLVKHGPSAAFYKDLSLGFEVREIIIHRQKWRCRCCGKTPLEVTPELDDRRQMTKRMIAFIGHKAAKYTFTAAADILEMSAKDVERIFKDYADDLLSGYTVKLSRVLCLDEKVLRGTACLLVADGETKRMLDLQPSRRDKDIQPYFFALDGRDAVEVVCQDMYRPYWRLTKKLFPRARTVIDKFHVVRMADWAVEIVRKKQYIGLPAADRKRLKRSRHALKTRWSTAKKDQREHLERVFAAYPYVREAYFVRERFYDVYDMPSRTGAQRALDDWEASLSPEMQRPFFELKRAIENWKADILRYFEYPFTNAIAEGLNRQIAEMNTVGRGYSFATMRRRALVRWGPFQGSEPVTVHAE